MLRTAEPDASTAFYAWLLDASPLDGHAVLAVEATTPDGPGPGWVPVFKVSSSSFENVSSTTTPSPEGNWSYLADEGEIWTGITSNALDSPGPGRSNVDYLSADTATAAAIYSRMLRLDSWAVVDDPYDFFFLVGGRRAAAGVVRFRTAANITAPRGWLVYHDVADIVGTVERALEDNCRFVVPIGTSRFNRFAVLLDPFGTPFGVSQISGEHATDALHLRDAAGEIRVLTDVIDLVE